MIQLDHIADHLDRSFIGGAWHGPGVMELLRSIDAETAGKRPANDAHNIAELVLHLHITNTLVIDRAEGKAGQVDEDIFFQACYALSPEDWHTMVNNLQQSHAKLVGLVRSFDRSRLHEPLYENDTSAFEHFLGSIQHNTYHAGQIALLKRLTAETS